MSYDTIFSRIANAKAVSQFAPKLGVGRHRVALKRFNVKESQKGGGPLVEAEFALLDDSGTPGDTRGWAWFISAKGPFAAQYQEGFLKEFITACGNCIGSKEDIKSLGAALAAPEQHGRGLVLDVEITNSTKNDGSPRTGANGAAFTNARWSAVQMTMEELAKSRARLDGVDAGAVASKAEVAPAPVTGLGGTNTAPTGLAGGITGLLGNR